MKNPPTVRAKQCASRVAPIPLFCDLGLPLPAHFEPSSALVARNPMIREHSDGVTRQSFFSGGDRWVVRSAGRSVPGKRRAGGGWPRKMASRFRAPTRRSAQ